MQHLRVFLKDYELTTVAVLSSIELHGIMREYLRLLLHPFDVTQYNMEYEKSDTGPLTSISHF